VTRIKVGVAIPTSGAASSRERVLSSTLEAERLGYDSIFSNDHIHNSPERHALWQSESVGMGSYKASLNTLVPNQFEVITTFAYLAAKTESIKFAVAVMPVLLRDPVVLAKELATLDTLSDGRVVLGVGVSNITDIAEFRALGRSFNGYSERYEMLGEYISAMKAIWTGEKTTFSGKYLNLNDLVVYPKPKGHLPIWVGAHTLGGGAGRPPVKFALEHADGWVYGFRMRPADVEAMVSDFRSTAAARGRDVSSFEWCFQLRLSIGVDEAQARRNCEWMSQDQKVAKDFAGYVRTSNYLAGKSKERAEAPRTTLEWMTIGRPDSVISAAGEFVDAGATSFELFFAYREYEELIAQMRLFAKEVLPSLR
jgi:alkanesulfonate monooxygenase SsuD/methylene tetrahydromethanopterin reductase-like flavin-dependent oxidoreductase (luciferase family)